MGINVAVVPRIAVSLFMIALLGMLISAILHLLSIDQSPLQILFGGAALAVVFTTQVVRSAHGGTRLRRRQQYWLLGVQALLTYTPFLVLGEAWVGLPGFLAGSVLLTFRPPWSWLAAGLVWLSVLGASYAAGFKALEVAWLAASVITTSIVVYGLTLLSEMVLQLRSAQQEIARLAVEQERLRFARDLHDLLGYSLSAITLRSELTLRLVDQHPARAREELSTVLEISRQALADTRQVARSYRDMSFPAELASARSVFGAAGVEIEVDCTLVDLPDQVGTVLATVLREGITNVLRHSSVRHCRIDARKADHGDVLLHVRNDGVRARPGGPDSHDGSGIGNLSTRVTSIGGTLSAGVRDDGCFHLEAKVPLDCGVDRRLPRPRLLVDQRLRNGGERNPDGGTRSAV
ncbi:sensor histidine kinase [Streptomyces sp. NPDC020681]|uniref:sensor histidine kinase n=1 Tax=Streptomyces sp. NPDC020681 TaxID=3365083 RepID=UPI00378DEFEF